MRNHSIKRIAGAVAAARGAGAFARLSPARLLIAAAIFHLTLTAACYGLGRLHLLPGTFDADGLAFSFARDSVMYRAEAAELSELLARGEARGWLAATYPFHSKLYSVCFALFGPWLGLNVVSAAPLNTLYYLTTLALVFALGREVFDRRAALLAAGAVGAWPSFLLHSTQLLKDPLFVAAMLAFILVLVRWLTREYSWPGALLAGAAGGGAAAVLWLVRDNMGEVVIATGLAGSALLVARQFAAGRVQPANLCGMALLLALTLGVTRLVPEYQYPEDEPHGRRALATRRAARAADAGEAAAAVRAAATPATRWSRTAARVGRVRRLFVEESRDAGSNIDVHVRIDSTADLVGYLPRAAAVGFFAPFPDMWFAAGARVGSTARLLSGLETVAMYGVEVLAVLGLWRGRRRLPVWLLLSAAAIGLVTLGLVVVNVGTLYRLRYAFLIPLIVIAAGAAARAPGRPLKPSGAGEKDAAV